MANDTVLIEIEPTLSKKGLKKTTKSFEKAGEKAGEKFTDGFEEGSKGVSDSLSNFTGSFGKVSTALAAVTAAAVVFGKKAVDAAVRQEDAVNALNNSLRRIGEFSQGTSKDLQDFASELQKTTRFGDEAAIEQLAFAQALGATAEQSKQVVKAAADLATGLNIDLGSATRNVAKTLGGFAGELGEVIPELKALTKEQLQAGAGIDLIAEKYDGLARGALNTFSGATEQAGNSIGDLFESFGFFITKNPTIISAINSITKSVGGLATEIAKISNPGIQAKLKKNFDSLSDVQRKLIMFKLENDDLFKNGVFSPKRSTPEIEEARRFYTSLIEAEKQYISERKELRRIEREESTQKKSEDNIKEQEELLTQLQKLGIISIEQLETNAINRLSVLEQARQKELISTEQFNAEVKRTEEKFEKDRLKILDKGNKKREKAQFDANKAFGSIVASGTAQFVDNLLTGQNASSAFADFVLGSFGDLATQMGQFYIADGIAKLALFSLGSPASQIAAGASLVALGQILGSFRSSGVGGFNTSGGSVSAGAGSSPTTTTETPDTASEVVEEQFVDEVETRSTTTVIFQGDILGDEASGERIVELINSANENTDVRLNSSVVA